MELWEEYRAVHPSGYGYSRFCDLFREFERCLSPIMRQDHPAGAPPSHSLVATAATPECCALLHASIC
jgi:transposase